MGLLSINAHMNEQGLPWWLRGQRICLKYRGFNSWVGKIPWRQEWLPTPVFLPRESHEQRSLAGYSPRDRKESDTTEQLSMHTCMSKLLRLEKNHQTEFSDIVTGVHTEEGLHIFTSRVMRLPHTGHQVQSSEGNCLSSKAKEILDYRHFCPS